MPYWASGTSAVPVFVMPYGAGTVTWMASGNFGYNLKQEWNLLLQQATNSSRRSIAPTAVYGMRICRIELWIMHFITAMRTSFMLYHTHF